MVRKRLVRFAFCLVGIVGLFGCGDESTSSTSPTSVGPSAARSFMALRFTKSTPYFSTTSGMSDPVDSVAAKAISDKIDFTYIVNTDYSAVGFFDPVSRSKSYYWDEFRAPWLSNAVPVQFYATTLTVADFQAAQADQSKIATYFTRPTTRLALHAIFPSGSCIGGRTTNNPDSEPLDEGDVFGWINTATGKHGLLYIRDDQSSGWKFTNYGTKVDIIVEN